MDLPNEIISNQDDKNGFDTILYEPPKGELIRMHLTHLGVILSNISIVALVISLSSIFAAILYGLLVTLGVLLWILCIICTLGLVFLAAPNFATFFESNFFTMPNIDLGVYLFIILGVGIATAIASIVLLSFDKYANHKGRIIFSSFVLVSVVIVLLIIIGGTL